MNATTTRRAVLAVLTGAGVTAGATIPAIAMPGADAELVALGARHAILAKEKHIAVDHQCACEDAAVLLLPPDQPALQRRGGDRLLLESPGRRSFEDSSDIYLEQEIEELRAKPRKRRYIVDFDPVTGQTWPMGTAPAHIRDALQKYEPWPEAQARAEEIIAAFDVYKRGEADIDQRSGFTQAQEIVEALRAELDAVRMAIATTPAKTVEGLGVKARLVAEWTEGGMNSAPRWTKVMISAIVRDVQAMG